MRHLFLLFFGLYVAFPQPVLAKHFAIQEWKTDNGTHVVFYQAMEVPMLNISIAFAAGSAYDGKQFGLSALTKRLLNQGNGGLDANTIADKLASTGAQYEAKTNQDMAVFSLKTLTEPSALKQSVEIFASIIGQPDFPQQAFEREKNQQLMTLAHQKELPDEVATQAFYQALYQTHPYAHPIEGTQERISPLTVEQVRHFYQQFFVSHNAVLVLVGAINQDTAKQLAEQITHHLPTGQSASVIPKALPLTDEMNMEIQFPSSQSVLRLGQLGIDHHNKDFFPLLVGNYTLGGGVLVSRLALELREKRGLTYGVYSQFLPMPGLGPFIISLATKSDQANTAIEVTRRTLSEFVTTGPNEQELTAAKQYLTGSFPLSLASSRDIANTLLRITFYHLPSNYLDTYIDRINAVSQEQVKQAFQKQITPNKLLQIIVGMK